jgi:hypothetical protein
MTAQVSIRARPAVSCNKEPATVNTRLYRLSGYLMVWPFRLRIPIAT